MKEMDIAELRMRAEQGDPEASLELGWRCHQGLGTAQDDREAVFWYGKSSSAQAKNNLGWMHQNGLGVPRNDGEAFRLYSVAAAEGYAGAHTNVGWMRMRGAGCGCDELAALASFRRAAELGCPAAPVWLERLKAENRIVPAVETKPAAGRPSERPGKERDPLEILVALNFCTVSISRIAASADRRVLDEEYREILENIDPAVMRGDDDLIGLFEELLCRIGADCLRDDEAADVRNLAERRMAGRLSDAMSGVKCEFDQGAAANAGATAAKLLFSLFGVYVRYRSLPERYGREADEAIRRLERERTRQYQELQRKFFGACSRLVSRYGLASRRLLMPEQIRTFGNILAEEDVGKALRLCSHEEESFAAYPPFWLRRGLLAADAGDAEKALACFDAVVEKGGGVLRKDPFLASALLASIELLPEDEREEKRSRLRKAREHFRSEDWMQYLVAGVHAYALEDFEFAEDCIQRNIDYGYYPELHRGVLKDRGLAPRVFQEFLRSLAGKADSPLAAETLAPPNPGCPEPATVLAPSGKSPPEDEPAGERKGFFGRLFERKGGRVS